MQIYEINTVFFLENQRRRRKGGVTRNQLGNQKREKLQSKLIDKHKDNVLIFSQLKGKEINLSLFVLNVNNNQFRIKRQRRQLTMSFMWKREKVRISKLAHKRR